MDIAKLVELYREKAKLRAQARYEEGKVGDAGVKVRLRLENHAAPDFCSFNIVALTQIHTRDTGEMRVLLSHSGQKRRDCRGIYYE